MGRCVYDFLRIQFRQNLEAVRSLVIRAFLSVAGSIFKAFQDTIFVDLFDPWILWESILPISLAIKFL